MEKRILSILVDNTSGVLSRVAGLLAAVDIISTALPQV